MRSMRAGTQSSSAPAAAAARRPSRPSPLLPAARASANPDGAADSAALLVAVCVAGKTCRKQGSESIHRFAVDLALPNLEVTSCGCLGACGSGPNVALAFDGNGDDPVVARHVATPAALVSLLRARWRPPPADGSAESSKWPAPLSERHLQAIQARLAGNAAAVEGELEEALARYGEALRCLGVDDDDNTSTLAPPSLGAHLVRSNMSAALLQLGRAEDAARVAELAERGAPASFCTATVRRVDALFALKRFEEAGEAARSGLKRHPTLRERPEWREIQGALRQKGVDVLGR
jgi:tetratricopeptide (TPR) repeat protein